MGELIGMMLANRYQVKELLGRGGMGHVYKVWDNQRAVFVAMKVLNADMAEDKVFLRRFKREAETLAALQHPHIVRFYGLDQYDGLTFMLMDYIEGITLRKLIFDEQGSLSIERMMQIVRPVCSALYYAHNMGRIHCDIKPANIMIKLNGDVLLADFGITRLLESSTTVTMVGAGTPAYMAPEQVLGKQAYPQTDLYSLGIVCFEMLTGGERPFTGEQAKIDGTTSEKVRWEQIKLKPPSLREFNSSISHELENIILKCLDKEVFNRHTTALDFLNELEGATDSPRTSPEIIVEQTNAIPSIKPPINVEEYKSKPKKTIILWQILLGIFIGIFLVFGTIMLFQNNSKNLLVTETQTGTFETNTPQATTTIITPQLIITLTPMAISTTTPSIPQLLLCSEAKVDACYYSPGMADGKFQIAIFIKDLNTKKIPYITLGKEKMSCKVSGYLSDVIICNGDLIENGVWDFELYSFDGKLIFQAEMEINFKTPVPQSKPSYPND